MQNDIYHINFVFLCPTACANPKHPSWLSCDKMFFFCVVIFVTIALFSFLSFFSEHYWTAIDDNENNVILIQFPRVESSEVS